MPEIVSAEPTSLPRDGQDASVLGRGGAGPGAFFRKIVEGMGDLVIIIDRGGFITYQSPSADGLFGEIASRSARPHVSDLVHPEDLLEVMDTLAATARHGGISGSPKQFRVRDAQGTWRWLEINARDQVADPNLAGIVLTARDVTDLRRQQIEYRQAERFAGFGFWRLELDTMNFTYSDGLYEFLGYSEADVVRDPDFVIDRVHPDDRSLVKRQIAHSLRTGEATRYKARAIAADGSYRIVQTEVFIEADIHGGAAAAIGICRDVTDRDVAVTALKASEEQYRLLAEQASDIIGRAAPDGTIAFMSPAIERVLGYTPEDMIGGRCVSYIHPEDEAVPAALFAPRPPEAPQVTYAYRARHIDGHYIWLETTTRAVFDGRTGELTEFIIVSRDISERKKFEMDLMAARERAEAASRTKSRFLANMSHELRTPLNAILGFSDIISKGMFGPLGCDKYSEYAQLIHDSGTLLLELITDILDMSKIEAGKYELHRESIDLNDLISGCLSMIRPKADDSQLTVGADLPERLPAFVADKRAMKQILLNLLSNAVKFTPAGGMVEVVLTPGEEVLEITVRDNGIGIPEEALPRLTQPFEQVVDDHTLAQSGSGLGLALVKALTRLHGGHLEIASEVGAGTEVTVHLPLGPGQQVLAHAS